MIEPEPEWGSTMTLPQSSDTDPPPPEEPAGAGGGVAPGEDDDLYKDLENLDVGGLRELLDENDSHTPTEENPFLSKSRPLPLITGNEDDDPLEIDGPDQLPVMADPYLTLKVSDSDGLEETIPITKRDRARSEAGERDAELAGLAFATHLAMQSGGLGGLGGSGISGIGGSHNVRGSGIVREDSSEGGLTLVPATPPPTPLSRTSSQSSNVSILQSSNLSLHTVGEEVIGENGQIDEENSGHGEVGEGEEGEESAPHYGRVSGGTMVVNPPTTPMASSTKFALLSAGPPSAATTSHFVPMTPPTTPQNRTQAQGGSTVTYQSKQTGFYKPVKPELKQRSGKGISTSKESGVPPPTPPVTPANRTGYGHGGRPPPISASNNINDPAPTPPPTPMAVITGGEVMTPRTMLRVTTTELGPDLSLPSLESPVVGSGLVRSRSASDYGNNENGTSTGRGNLSELKGHLSNSLLASKFAELTLPQSEDEAKTPRVTNTVVVACLVFECSGRAFLRGYCAKHWRLAKKTPQEMLDGQTDGVGESEGEEGESKGKEESEPLAPASFEYTLPWLVNGEDGESHWQDWKENLIPASWSSPTPPSETVVYGSQEFRVTNLVIQEYLPNSKTAFECSPTSQLLTIMTGMFSIQASDGKAKTFTPGNVILLQDHVGKGHQIAVVGSGKHLLSRALLQSTSTSSTSSLK